MWTGRSGRRFDRHGLFRTTTSLVWLSRHRLIATERNQFHSALGTIRRRRAGNFWVHRADVARDRRSRGGGAGALDSFRHLEIKRRRRAGERGEEQHSDEIEMTSDEFHRFQ